MPAPHLEILTEYYEQYGPDRQVWVATLKLGSFPWFLRLAPSEAEAYSLIAEVLLTSFAERNRLQLALDATRSSRTQ